MIIFCHLPLKNYRSEILFSLSLAVDTSLCFLLCMVTVRVSLREGNKDAPPTIIQKQQVAQDRSFFSICSSGSKAPLFFHHARQALDLHTKMEKSTENPCKAKYQLLNSGPIWISGENNAFGIWMSYMNKSIVFNKLWNYVAVMRKCYLFHHSVICVSINL